MTTGSLFGFHHVVTFCKCIRFRMKACDFTKVEEIIGVISDFLDFRTYAIHRIPEGLPAHNLCGAHSMAFLAHVIMNMPLPETVAEVRTLHTNMRASFCGSFVLH